MTAQPRVIISTEEAMIRAHAPDEHARIRAYLGGISVNFTNLELRPHPILEKRLEAMSLLTRLLGYYTVVADATKELFIRILMGVLIFLGYVLLSLFIYAVMRRIMVPQKLHVIPVHLQYRSVLVHHC